MFDIFRIFKINSRCFLFLRGAGVVTSLSPKHVPLIELPKSSVQFSCPPSESVGHHTVVGDAMPKPGNAH